MLNTIVIGKFANITDSCYESVGKKILQMLWCKKHFQFYWMNAIEKK